MLIEFRKRLNVLGFQESTRNLAAACQCKARPHTSSKTGAAITKFGLTLLPQPPYGPDLAPSEMNVFAALKDAIRCATVEC
jgi:transposase